MPDPAAYSPPGKPETHSRGFLGFGMLSGLTIFSVFIPVINWIAAPILFVLTSALGWRVLRAH